MSQSSFFARATAGMAVLLTLQSTAWTAALPLGTMAPGTLAQENANPEAIHIVVLEGDNATNIIGKRVSVAPVVQVLNQDGQPVNGASVTYTVPVDGPSVVLDNSRSITIITGDNGKAIPASIIALNAGSFEYRVIAVFRGQRAEAAIKQTNVASFAGVAKTGAGNAVASSHKVWWIVGGVAAAAAVGIGVGVGHGGSGVPSTTPTAVIGAGTGATAGAPH